MTNWRTRGMALALIVIVLDQLSKWWVVTQLFGDRSVDFIHWLTHQAPQLDYAVKEVASFFNLVMVWNPGVSFGFLQNAHDYAAHGLTIMAIVFCAGLLVWLWREPTMPRAVSIGLIVGGALGNVWDRVRFGAVADFLDLHWKNMHWPAFNVADTAICLGVAFLLVETFFFSKTQERASS